MDTRAVGIALIDLGGGRRRTSDVLDLSVGFSQIVAVGAKVTKGDVLAVVHAADEAAANSAVAVLGRLIHIDDPEPVLPPLIAARIAAAPDGA